MWTKKESIVHQSWFTWDEWKKRRRHSQSWSVLNATCFETCRGPHKKVLGIWLHEQLSIYIYTPWRQYNSSHHHSLVTDVMHYWTRISSPVWFSVANLAFQFSFLDPRNQVWWGRKVSWGVWVVAVSIPSIKHAPTSFPLFITIYKENKMFWYIYI